MTKTTRKRRAEADRKTARDRARKNQEHQHQRSRGGGQPNELGVLQGQNAEQGNTVERRQARPLGKLSH